MSTNASGKQPLSLLRSALNTLIEKPIVLFPFSILVFIQLLILEILFFAPRFPLIKIFGPIIRNLAGEVYLHYPFNFTVLSGWFQNTYLQGALFVVINAYCIGVAVAIINELNAGRTVHISALFKKIGSSYVHLFAAGLLIVTTMFGVAHLHDLLIQRAILIRSTTGLLFILKQGVLISAPYLNLLMAIVVAALFIFVIPIIIIEKKKVFPALMLNFKTLRGNFWFTFIVLLFPALLFVPLILLRMNSTAIQQQLSPEVWIWVAVVGALLSILVDAVHYTAMTTFYLLRKEAK